MCHRATASTCFGRAVRLVHFALIPTSMLTTPARAATDVLEIVITASTVDMLGKADSASAGSITAQEIEQRPVYRVGQLLETVPGLTVTAHSGEGKANQYLLRGFNLDHGTDLATSVDGMTTNERTHAHGQGYTDLNFLIPELVAGIDFTKGPYEAAEGDFATVGANHLRLANAIPAQAVVSAGTVGDRRLFAAASARTSGDSQILAAGEYFTLDGPWVNPDHFRKLNGVLRWSVGDTRDGLSLTAMGYRGRWNATTDQPERAIAGGTISRFGSLDPTDGGRSIRYSLSANGAGQRAGWQYRFSAFAIRQSLTLWNDFTHVLDDPVDGDQHAQSDHRTVLGGGAAASREVDLGAFRNTITAGVQVRYDAVHVDLVHTRARQPLATIEDDRIDEASVGTYLEDRTNWMPWLRTVVGLRDDLFHVRDRNRIGGLSGTEDANLVEFKGSAVFGPWAKTEFYLAAGQGFHSNDGRAGMTEQGVLERPPLLVRSTGIEAGIRTDIVRHLTLAAAIFRTDFASELIYDADAGATEAGRPSRRTGVEVTGQYRPVRWLELNANLAFTHARYRDQDPAGRHIEDAPKFIGSAGFLIDNLGRWFGAMAWRDLGAHPLTEDNGRRSSGYSEVNTNIGYKLTDRIRVQIDVFNLTNSRRDAADYYYTTRLPGEPVEGVAGTQIHPLEPRSARFTIAARL